MAYRFVQGIDYGPRKGTLGWNVHMAEGGDGTLGWLARRPGESNTAWRDRVNGVSASFVILQGGEVVQMVAWDHAAGNLNPNDRSTDKAFYGRRYLLEVLGDKWRDPNAYTLSVELCGFRANGPSRAQVESLVKLVAESRERYPGMVGAFGHADQTDTKGCPGTAPLMREFWDRLGHGRFAGDTQSGDDVSIAATPQGTIYAYIVRTSEDAVTYGPDTGERGSISAGFVGNAMGVYGLDGLGGKRAFWVGKTMSYVLESSVTAELNSRDVAAEPAPSVPVKYPVTVGTKLVGEVELP